VAAILTNDGPQKTVRLRLVDKEAEAAVPARSISTFTWKS
jgi:hypothetical protein